MQTNKKVCPALQCQADQLKITLDNSIAYSAENIPVAKRDPIGLDSFKGNVRSFRLYLKSQLIMLNAGVIAP